MIEFKKGKFNGGNLQGQVHLGMEEAKNNDLWDNQISDDNWIFTIGDSGVGLFNVYDYDICFIPRKIDFSNEHYSLFWNSELTLVFDMHNQALNYLRNYKGEFKDLVFGAYLQIERELSFNEIFEKYMAIDDLEEESNDKFYNDLMRFIISKNLSVDSTLATMKSFILDCYRDEIVDQKLNKPQ